MAAGLVKGEDFAVDASVMEANASRYHGKASAELDWTDATPEACRSPSILLDLRPKRRSRKAGTAPMAVLRGHRQQSPIASRQR
jgi:hypothetical protein